MKINYSNENWTDLGFYSKFYNSTYTKIPLEDHNLHQQKSPQFQTQIYLVKVPLNVSVHSMARANLNKSEWLVTNTTAASKYIPS